MAEQKADFNSLEGMASVIVGFQNATPDENAKRMWSAIRKLTDELIALRKEVAELRNGPKAV